MQYQTACRFEDFQTMSDMMAEKLFQRVNRARYV